MKHLGVLALSLAFASSAFAAPACSTYSNYAQLIESSGCEIGDKLFTDFFFGFGESGGAIEVEADDIGLNVVNQGDAAIGFDFINIPLSAGAGQSATITIGYNVSTLSLEPIITSNFLAFTAGTTGETGLATVKESFCIGGVRPCAAGGTLAFLEVAISPFEETLSDKAVFTGVKTIGVTKDIFVSGGSRGTATISVVTNTVDQNGGGDDVVPEPGTYALLGGGLISLAYLKRRKA